MEGFQIAPSLALSGSLPGQSCGKWHIGLDGSLTYTVIGISSIKFL